jgi:DNA uptake protein ComE-like DNA-binding protein
MLLLVTGACQGDAADTDTTAMAATDTIMAPATSTAADGAMLDPNSASRDQLMSVPGMNAAAADALIAGRPYSTMLGADSALAAHLSSEARAEVYARLWRPIDLNTASGAEILLIPGVGARMQHEFEEYRPYRGIEQFRREIGKYVDSAEVARLERYIAIR